MLVAVDRLGLEHRHRAVVVHPVEAEGRIELGTVARREEAVGEQAAGCVEDEDEKLRFRDPEPVRPAGLGQEADDGVDVFDIVDHRPVRMIEAIVDGRTIRTSAARP